MCCICRLEEEAFWATSWQNQQNDFCAQRRLRSAWASAQSDQSLPSEDSDQPGLPPSLIKVFAVRSVGSLGPNFASGGQRWLWLDWVDAQANLSLRCAHRSFCWFCHAVAQFSYWNHFRNHCVWHWNEFAYASLTWCKRCSQTTPRWQHD